MTTGRCSWHFRRIRVNGSCDTTLLWPIHFWWIVHIQLSTSCFGLACAVLDRRLIWQQFSSCMTQWSVVVAVPVGCHSIYIPAGGHIIYYSATARLSASYTCSEWYYRILTTPPSGGSSTFYVAYRLFSCLWPSEQAGKRLVSFTVDLVDKRPSYVMRALVANWCHMLAQAAQRLGFICGRNHSNHSARDYYRVRVVRARARYIASASATLVWRSHTLSENGRGCGCARLALHMLLVRMRTSAVTFLMVRQEWLPHIRI